MKCFFCGSELSKVVDKRSVKSLGEIRRRRECLKCRKRYTTYERVSEVAFFVVKRDGRRELFDRSKLLKGLERSLEKRPGIDNLGGVVGRIESKLISKGKREIPSTAIGALVLTELKKLDKVAYLRFASVYRDFKEPGDFARELQGLEDPGQARMTK
jgi:transcriptional repressor NrdR